MDRQPVQTYVLEHDWGVLGDAMRRELERGGQVYYLHNRVETIDQHRRPHPGDAGGGGGGGGGPRQDEPGGARRRDAAA